MWPGWRSSDCGLHWQAVACGDLGIIIWDWERMPAMCTGLGGRMKGKRQSMNEFRNTHAICEWLLSLCWTCTRVSTATSESPMILSHGWEGPCRPPRPSQPTCCSPTPTAAGAQATWPFQVKDATSSKKSTVLACRARSSLPRHQRAF